MLGNKRPGMAMEGHDHPLILGILPAKSGETEETTKNLTISCLRF